MIEQNLKINLEKGRRLAATSLVMAGLLLASIWVWMIIVSFSLRMRKLRSRTIEYESEFWQAESFDRFTSERGSKDIPAARVAQAAVPETARAVRSASVAQRRGIGVG